MTKDEKPVEEPSSKEATKEDEYTPPFLTLLEGIWTKLEEKKNQDLSMVEVLKAAREIWGEIGDVDEIERRKAEENVRTSANELPEMPHFRLPTCSAPDKPARDDDVAFMMWWNENWQQFQERNPGLSVLELVKVGRKAWDEIEDKSEWMKAVEEARARLYLPKYRPYIPMPKIPDIPMPKIPDIPLPRMPKIPMPKIPDIPMPKIPDIPLPRLPVCPICGGAGTVPRRKKKATTSRRHSKKRTTSKRRRSSRKSTAASKTSFKKKTKSFQRRASSKASAQRTKKRNESQSSQRRSLIRAQRKRKVLRSRQLSKARSSTVGRKRPKKGNPTKRRTKANRKRATKAVSKRGALNPAGKAANKTK